MTEKCLECGKHPLVYIHCDEWRCPMLGVRKAIELPPGGQWGEMIVEDSTGLVLVWSGKEWLRRMYGAAPMPDSDDLGLVEDDDDTVIEPHDYTGDYELESEPGDEDDEDE